MIKKTKDYNIFKFRQDNREKISQGHVETIIESINMRNLLHMRPICVNKDMEVLEGQHRLLAAKALGVEIYYEVREDLSPKDMILLNTAKQWAFTDYQNYYVKNNYAEYLKLEEFNKRHGFGLKQSLCLSQSEEPGFYSDFKKGNFKFDKLRQISDIIPFIKHTQEILYKYNGHSAYARGVWFLRALIRLFEHPDFEVDKWFANLKRMVEKMGPRSTMVGYYKLILNIYNWRNNKRIPMREEMGEIDDE